MAPRRLSPVLPHGDAADWVERARSDAHDAAAEAVREWAGRIERATLAEAVEIAREMALWAYDHAAVRDMDRRFNPMTGGERL